MIGINIQELKPPYFIHSDIFFVRNIFKTLNKKYQNVDEYLKLNKDLIYDLFKDEFVIPAFNYDFGETKVFDAKNDQSQVGALTEYIRKDKGIQRSHVPFYSTLSSKNFVKTQEKIFPFGKNSIFDIFYKKSGTIIQYGCNFKDGLTMLHYIEQIDKVPVYRYEKIFNGQIILNNINVPCEVKMHVRPKNFLINYDWEKIILDLENQNLIIKSNINVNIRAMSSNLITDFISEKMQYDELYLLNSECKNRVKKKLDSLGRSFNILDFENE